MLTLIWRNSGLAVGKDFFFPFYKFSLLLHVTFSSSVALKTTFLSF